jgi:hypothetical protein
MKGNPLKWKLNPSPHFPHVEALTEKWRYRVHSDIHVDDHWVAWREFRHRGLSDCCVGELLEDTFLSFDDALAQAERWHTENDADHDIEWIQRASFNADPF